jgi:flagellar hook-basal body complex protein FliE
MVLPPIADTSVDHCAAKPDAGSFGQMLKNSIDQVGQLQQQSSESINGLVTGKHTNIHQTMIAMEKSSVAFELLMQSRNKVVDAYKEIMRTPI